MFISYIKIDVGVCWFWAPTSIILSCSLSHILHKDQNTFETSYYIVEINAIIRLWSYKYVRNDSITDRVIRTPQNIIGLKLSKNYKPLSPIYDTDLTKPEIIKKNTKVVISVKTKNLKLETSGKLLENAQLNQVASVINLSSKRIIDCIVKSPTEVTPVGF